MESGGGIKPAIIGRYEPSTKLQRALIPGFAGA